jgi:hypothetical protein
MRYFIKIIYLAALTAVPILTWGITWTEHAISSDLNGPSSISWLDLNQDGRTDIIATAINANQVCWFENDGGNPPGWTPHVVTDTFVGACSAWPYDLDGDDDIDLACAAWTGGRVAWFENTGGTPPQWIEHPVNNSFLQAHEICVADLDRDGDPDLLAVAAQSAQVAWWENCGGSPIAWIKHIIRYSYQGGRSVCVRDINADGEPDVLGSAANSQEITIWFGTPDSSWIQQVVDNQLNGAHQARFFDLDGDADQDIVAAGYLANQVVWYQNDGGNPIVWSKHIIDPAFTTALCVDAADFDRDGYLDVCATATGSSDVAWYRNTDGSGLVWVKEFIDPSFSGAWPILAVDIDDDSDADVVSGASNTVLLSWWQNGTLGAGEEQNRHIAPPRTGCIFARSLRQIHKPGVIVYDISGAAIIDRDPGSGVYFYRDGDITGQLIIVK